MNLDKMFVWITAIVIAFAAAGRLDVLQTLIWRAQAKVIYESRASTWGSPRFFSAPTQLRMEVPPESSRREMAQ